MRLAWCVKLLLNGKLLGEEEPIFARVVRFKVHWFRKTVSVVVRYRQSAFCECRIANCPPEAPPEAPPEVDSPRAKDLPLTERARYHFP